MSEDLIERMRAHPKYARLRHRRSAFGARLIFLLVVAYLGLLLSMAFAPAFLANSLPGGGTVGLLICGSIILLAIALPVFYVRRANREYDRLTRDIAREVR